MLTRETLAGARPFPFALLALVHYESSPVGAYDEVAVIALTRRGPSVIEMLVNSPESRRLGRANWGFPKELAALRWHQTHHGQGRHLRFEAPGRVWRLCACLPALPFRLAGFTSQCRDGLWLRVPVQLQGRARLGFRGKQLALLIEEFQMQVGPAL